MLRWCDVIEDQRSKNAGEADAGKEQAKGESRVPKRVHLGQL